VAGRPVILEYAAWDFILALGIGLALLYSEGRRPSRWSWVLVFLALLFAFLSVAREEPFSSGINLWMTFFILALLAATLRNGNWFHYRMMDSFLALMRAGWAAMSGLPMLLMRKREQAEQLPVSSPLRLGWTRAVPFLRGLLLAVPVLLVLGGLLSAADPLFSDQMARLFNWLRFDNLEEFLFRAFYIALFTYTLVGIYVHAVEREESRPDISRQMLAPFLGFTESCVVLVLVDLMFMLFVGIQAVYLFGGQANINTTGFTYADYARRGFFELATVAVLSLMLYLTLGYITRRKTGRQNKFFTILVVVELLLVMVILVSAFQRMALYQGAYGFSELRVQVNVLMIWLGLLLAATIFLEISRRSRHFGLAALLFCLGFVFTMGVFNMDGFIATQNIERAKQGTEFDAPYLYQLSSDATPAIYAQFSSGTLSPRLKAAMGEELDCRAQRAISTGSASWLSLRFSKQAADDLLLQHAAEWQEYKCPYYLGD
jgi:hypothetical protein